MQAAYWQGLVLCAGLIMAIGAQNAHVLRMGLTRQHALLTASICALCDALLIAAGLLGLGALFAHNPALMAGARWGGAAYLVWFAWRALRAALQPGTLETQGNAMLDARQALLAALGFSLLNPHVYLDTVLLLGSVGAQHAGNARWWFGAGAVTASLAWFFSLALSAHALSPWLQRRWVWRVVDLATAAVMLALAIKLVRA